MNTLHDHHENFLHSTKGVKAYGLTYQQKNSKKLLLVEVKAWGTPMAKSKAREHSKILKERGWRVYKKFY